MRTFICLQPIPTFSAPHLDVDFSPLILNTRLRYIKLFVFLKTNKILQVIISVYLYFYVRSKRAGRNTKKKQLFLRKNSIQTTFLILGTAAYGFPCKFYRNLPLTIKIMIIFYRVVIVNICENFSTFVFLVVKNIFTMKSV